MCGEIISNVMPLVVLFYLFSVRFVMSDEKKHNTMQRYIEQLIVDLRQATWKMKPPHELWEESGADPDDELELEDMSYVEKYMYGVEEPISGITGIELEKLPPEAKLTLQQQALLASELENLLQYFHFYLDFPKNYPAHLRYPFILKFWTEEHVALSFGESHIEFCDYDEENCPFPGYCNTCKEVAEQMKFDEEQCRKVGSDIDIDVSNLLPSPEEIKDFMKQQGIVIEEDIEENQFLVDLSENEVSGFEDLNGIYDDDGNEIDLNSIPLPGLCTICKKYQVDDWDENLLCLMNRNDQRNEPEFKCGAYKKL